MTELSQLFLNKGYNPTKRTDKFVVFSIADQH